MYTTGGGYKALGSLPASLLEELDPLAAKKPSDASFSNPALQNAIQPPPSKPKPLIIGRSSGPILGSQTVPTNVSSVAVSNVLLLDEALSAAPVLNDRRDLPCVGHVTKPSVLPKVATKPTVIRPKGKAPQPAVLLVSTAESQPPRATLSQQPAIVSARSTAAASPQSDAIQSHGTGVPSIGQPAPQRPAKPAPPRPTKGPAKQPPTALSSAGVNGIAASRSSADLQGLIVAPPSPMAKASVDDIAVFPSRSGNWPELPSRPAKGHPLHHYMITEPHAIALFSYSPLHSDELALCEGDVVILKRKVNNEWHYGAVGNHEGIFPTNFVTIKIPLMEGPANVNHTVVSITGPRCVARFDFDAEQEGDLSFVEGDVIQLVERNGLEWLKGIKGGKTGCFPSAFVEVIEDLPLADQEQGKDKEQPQHQREDVQLRQQAAAARHDMTHSGLCSADPNLAIATNDFDARDGSELSLKAGICVYVLGQCTNDWLYGEANGTSGLFPAAFIDHIPHDLPPWSDRATTRQDDISASNTGVTFCAREDHEMCVALYDFEAQASGDLSFVAGDKIRILSCTSNEWWEGELEDGKRGVFPATFVQKL